MSQPPLIVLAGGSGFVGRHLAPALVNAGYRVRILTRDASRLRDLRVLPTLETAAHPGIYEPGTLGAAIRGASVVVNLVGILHQGFRQESRFSWVHGLLTDRLLEAARAEAVPRFLHVSALRAELPHPPSAYLRSKAEAEERIRRSGLDWYIVRPSVIYGPDDDFLKRFARLLQWSPGILPLACPKTPLAPVDIADVVRVLRMLIDGATVPAQAMNLEGYETLTLKAVVEAIAETLHLRRLIVGLPDGASWLMGALLQWMPHPPFTLDNYRSLRALSCASAGSVADGFSMLGITPKPFRNRIPAYLESRGA
jgi:NADH dehydrogenase